MPLSAAQAGEIKRTGFRPRMIRRNDPATRQRVEVNGTEIELKNLLDIFDQTDQGNNLRADLAPHLGQTNNPAAVTRVNAVLDAYCGDGMMVPGSPAGTTGLAMMVALNTDKLNAACEGRVADGALPLPPR